MIQVHPTCIIIKVDNLSPEQQAKFEKMKECIAKWEKPKVKR